jgi:DNA-binding transcriptional MerR regulator
MAIPDKTFPDKLRGYNDEMTISQVVKFFERHGIFFTKTMIQNYVRVEVLPPPADKRYYTKKHLLFLYMIDGLKNVYSLEEIKKAFAPVILSFDTSDMYMIYNRYAAFYESFIREHELWREHITAEIEETASGAETKAFLQTLSLVSASLAAKKIAEDTINPINRREHV